MAIRYWSPTVVHDDGAPPYTGALVAGATNAGPFSSEGDERATWFWKTAFCWKRSVLTTIRASAVLGTLVDELLAWALDETETAI